MDAPILDVQNHGHIRQADAVTLEGVVNGEVRAGAPHFARQGRSAGGGHVVGRQQQIPWLDSATLAGAVGGNPLGLESSGGFDPPHAIGGGLIAAFLDQVEAGAHNRSPREERQQHGDNAGLEGALHAKCRGSCVDFSGDTVTAGQESLAIIADIDQL